MMMNQRREEESECIRHRHRGSEICGEGGLNV